jgi:hypothetical protein
MYGLVRPSPMLYMSWALRWTGSPCYTPLKRAAKPPRFAPPRTEPRAFLKILLCHISHCFPAQRLVLEKTSTPKVDIKQTLRRGNDKKTLHCEPPQAMSYLQPHQVIRSCSSTSSATPSLLFHIMKWVSLVLIVFDKVRSVMWQLKRARQEAATKQRKLLEDNTVNCLAVRSNLQIRLRLQGSLYSVIGDFFMILRLLEDVVLK